jgi:hypothetical protein
MIIRLLGAFVLVSLVFAAHRTDTGKRDWSKVSDSDLDRIEEEMLADELSDDFSLRKDKEGYLYTKEGRVQADEVRFCHAFAD